MSCACLYSVLVCTLAAGLFWSRYLTSTVFVIPVMLTVANSHVYTFQLKFSLFANFSMLMELHERLETEIHDCKMNVTLKTQMYTCFEV